MDLVAQQKQSVEVQKGLFLIRYDSANDAANPPRILISSESSNAGDVNFILPPDTDETVLWSPGACIVMLVNRSGRIDLSVSPSQPDGSVGAKIRLVPLSNRPDGKATAEQVDTVSEGEFDISKIQLLAHVAGTGDIAVSPGEWIAGPTAPARIEGLALGWKNNPRDIRLRYAVRVGGPRPTPMEMVDAGSFAGTRGRALPLIGATLELSGSRSSGHQLAVEALFLGSPLTKAKGKRLVLRGPTGREPMVGFKLWIDKVDHETAMPAVGSKKGDGPARTKSDRVRVVRARRTEPIREHQTATDSVPAVDEATRSPHLKPKASDGPKDKIRVFRKDVARVQPPQRKNDVRVASHAELRNAKKNESHAREANVKHRHQDQKQKP